MARQYTLQRHAAPGPRIDFAAELNEQQCAAVTAAPGPALVIAGAGSGKTRTLTYRVAYLVENGVPPSNILLLTFTNKAAREMLDRVASLLPNDISGLWGGTFHSVGNRILRRHPVEAGFGPGFSIMDREDQQDMLDAVIAALGIDPKEKRFPKGEVLADVFSYALNTGRTIEQVLVEKYPHFLEFSGRIAEAQRKYETKKKAANSLDFDDLLEKTLHLLQENPAIAEHYQRQFQFVLVDEYQDTNRLQADFIDILARHHGNVMVVGDDAQSIYSWRGANFKNILDFPKRYPGAKIYKIETNYRSAPDILDVANAAIAANVNQFKKELVAVRPAAALKPALVPLDDSNQQALFVAQRILDLREEGIDLKEIAVLYRAHYHSIELQLALTNYGIPYEIVSGIRFFEQAHIKDVSAFLKFVVNTRDEIAFKRMVRLLPGIGARNAEQLFGAVDDSLSRDGNASWQVLLAPLKVPTKSSKAWVQLIHTLEEIAPARRPLLPAEMIRIVLEAVYEDVLKSEHSDWERRKDEVMAFADYAAKFPDASAMLSSMALTTSLDRDAAMTSSDDEERIYLSTVHQAKGLEWKVVFVIWMADGMFPSSRSLESEDAIEEERRLFYVAVTRAKDELYLTYPNLRLNAGYGEMLQRPSRFLLEVPKTLVEEWQISRSY